MTTPEFDLLIKNVRVVRPHGNVVHDSDIAIKDGQFALVARATSTPRCIGRSPAIRSRSTSKRRCASSSVMSCIRQTNSSPP